MNLNDMRSGRSVRSARWMLVAAALACAPVASQAQRDEIGYQGQLSEGGVPATGTFDFEFRLFDAAEGGAQVGDPVVADDVAVANGLFSLGLAFPSGFDGPGPRFLEIAVRAGHEDGSFATLAGRVPFRSVPYSMDADTLDGFHATHFAEADHEHPLQPHVHDSLYAPGDDTTAAVAVEPDGDVRLVGRLLFDNLAQVEAEPGSLHFSWPGVASTLTAEGDNGSVVLGPNRDTGGADFALLSQSGGVPDADGGELLLVGGHGSPVGVGGAGGSIVLNAGWGLGTGPSKGGDVVLVPGAGTLGMDGSVYLDGRTVVPQLLKIEKQLQDKDGDAGAAGQLLSSTGGHVDWIDAPKPGALTAPNGTTVLSVDNGQTTTAIGDLAVGGDATVENELHVGDVRFDGGMSLDASFADDFRLWSNGEAALLRVQFQSDDVNILASPAPGGSVSIRPEATFTEPKGVNLGLSAGIPSAGSGGDLLLSGGNAMGVATNPGGDVKISGGFGSAGGARGDVEIQSNLSVNRTNPQHPFHVGNGPTNGNGAHVTAGGMWTNGSDANTKENFAEVDARDVLARVLELPVTTWRYKGEGDEVRHMGPMAQDFRAAFGLGEAETHIGTVDADGVALAAIKGLHAEMAAQLEALRAENRELRERLASIESAENAR